MPSPRLLSIVGPGLLVAATGVGAGDLATGAFAGAQLGTAVLWAVLLGAFLKFVLTEGLARWQLATGETILEGAIRRLGPVVNIAFIAYLLPWSFFVGAALISACGVTASAMLPDAWLGDDPIRARLSLGMAHSALGVFIAWMGGFKLFERLMAACVGLMFVCVVVTAVLVRPDVSEVARGLIIPRIPNFSDGGLTWTIALLGGVGGTLTVICYGYWIRDAGRTGREHLATCRIDLGVGYLVTALFGLAMVVIADGMTLDKSGSRLLVVLADQLEATLGPVARWIFLVGAWAAMTSSLIGVWQSVPYVFSDWLRLQTRRDDPALQSINIRGWAYRLFLLALAVVPAVQVHHPFKQVQKYYAVMGAAFLPCLAVVLLVLNGRAKWVGGEWRNRPVTTVVLVLTVLMFVMALV